MDRQNIINIPNEEVNSFDIEFGYIKIQAFLLCRWFNRTKIEGSNKQLIIANTLFWLIMIILLAIDIAILSIAGLLVLIWLIGKFIFVEIFQKFLNPLLAKIFFTLFIFSLIVITILILIYRFPIIKDLVLTIFDNSLK